MKKSILTLLCGLSLYGCQQATIRQVELTMDTYPYSDPNPVANPGNVFYPYYTFDGYSHQAEPQKWNGVVLENNFVKVTIMPEIGGKIWGAVEKSTNQEFIYYNKTVKFRNVAMRGPWTSGGIEANFGVIGHAPLTSSPVDYAIRNNDNGSVSCYVGALDMLTSTWWCVEINLEKDKSYFTTKTTWNNASPLGQPYYHWMNAGYRVGDDLTFCFPGNSFIGHGGDVHSWPITEEGRNLSRYAENNFGGPKSEHVCGELGDFYGAYWGNTNFGSVHHSDYDDKLGMKVWVWGLSREGMIWEDLLTDNDGQYCELQSGRMFNQAASNSNLTPYKHITFHPYTTDKWTEYWYPVKNTGPFVKAGKIGALNVVRNNDNVNISFCPTGKIKESVKVVQDGEVIFEDIINETTLSTWTANITTQSANPLQVTIGNDLLVYEENPQKRNTSRPQQKPHFDWNSLYGLYMDGKLWMDQRYYTRANTSIDKALAIDSNYIPALNLKATLYLRNGKFDSALIVSKRALSIDTYNDEANYLYGLINSRLCNTVDAQDGYSVASISTPYRLSAYIGLISEHVKNKHFSKAKHYVNKAMEIAPDNQNVIQLAMLVARKAGDITESRRLMACTERQYPLNHYTRAEALLLDNDAYTKQRFIDKIQSENPYQSVVEVAGWYENLACNDDALKILNQAPLNPLVKYRIAHLYNKLGNKEKAKQTLSEGLELSTQFTLPYRLETLAALQWANSVLPHWKTSYYLGLNHWAIGNTAQSEEQLDLCGDIPQEANFYLTRALLRKNKAKELDLLRAEQLNNDWRTGLALINYYKEADDEINFLAYSKKYNALYPNNYNIGLKYAAALSSHGEYDRCIDYLSQLKVLPNEGAMEGRIVYRNANLFSAINNIKSGNYTQALQRIEQSKMYIENLGVGKPYDDDIDLRTSHYLSAKCYECMGDKTKAKEYYDKVITHKQRYNANTLITALAQQATGQSTDITIKQLLRHGKNKTVIDYTVHIINGNKKKAEESLLSAKAWKEVAPWATPTADNDLLLVKTIVDKL
ncbi:MAG: DUF5107 domain-containing protein [Marinifilaceae bacterium]